MTNKNFRWADVAKMTDSDVEIERWGSDREASADELSAILQGIADADKFVECNDCGLIHSLKKDEHVKECFQCGSKDLEES